MQPIILPNSKVSIGTDHSDTKSTQQSNSEIQNNDRKENEEQILVDSKNILNGDECITSNNENKELAYRADAQKLICRLDDLTKENQQFRLSNDRLQYWLTVLESENESIGEYVSIVTNN